jgi:hypothetical protein
LVQAPYSRLGRQGVCDSRQACGVRDIGKAVPVLGKPDSVLLGLTGDILVAVQDDLGAEGRMPRHLNRDVPPFAVQNVKAVVLHVRLLLNQLPDSPLLGAANLPNGSDGARDQDQEQALHRGMAGDVLFADVMFPLAALTVDHGNTVGFGEGIQAPAEAARQTHQMSVIQLRVRAIPQSAPPGSEPSGGIADRIESVQHDAIHTSVSAVKKSGIVAAQFVSHERERYTRQTRFSTARQGQFFRAQSRKKRSHL